MQNIPETLPVVPSWQTDRVESRQSLLPVHAVVHAAKSPLPFEQLKQVVPDGQGLPHSEAKVVQTPCTQVTLAVASNRIVEPSSVVGGPSPQPHLG